MKKKMNLATEIDLTQDSVVQLTCWCGQIALHELWGLGRVRLDRITRRQEQLGNESLAVVMVPDRNGMPQTEKARQLRAEALPEGVPVEFRVPAMRTPRTRREQQLKMVGDLAATMAWQLMALACVQELGFGAERLNRLYREMRHNYEQLNEWGKADGIEVAMEKLRRGQYIMVREGTAAQNMESLLPLFREPYCSRCMLVTDDKHPGDLLQGGHIDYIIRKAIAAGVDPVVAVRMGTLVPCQYFGLAHSGAVAPGYTADLIVLSDLEQFTVEQVYKKGELVAQQGRMLHPAALAVDKARFARVFDSFNMDKITPEQLQLKQTGTRQRVICLTPHALLTTEKIVPFCQHPGTAPGVDVAQKIVKLAVFERHQRSGHVGLGFLGNYGLQCGAVASSIAHDSHNLIVAGTNDADMVLAGNTVRKNKGGLAFALNGQVVGELPLPVAGLMSTESAETVEEKLQALKAALKAHGISEDIDAFMTLAFVSLPVIPKLRLNTYGIVDVDAQQIVPAVF